eukprot:12318486-Alexandrium_andersonii.AAC.1
MLAGDARGRRAEKRRLCRAKGGLACRPLPEPHSRNRGRSLRFSAGHRTDHLAVATSPSGNDEPTQRWLTQARPQTPLSGRIMQSTMLAPPSGIPQSPRQSAHVGYAGSIRRRLRAGGHAPRAE